MKKKDSYLTGSEEELMELFWEKNVPLTSVEILQIGENHSWNGNYLHMMLRNLIKKGLLEVCGLAQYGSQYARKFHAIITKEEYVAKLVMLKGKGKNYVTKVAAAMIQEIDNTDEADGLINELEIIIEDLKKGKYKDK